MYGCLRRSDGQIAVKGNLREISPLRFTFKSDLIVHKKNTVELKKCSFPVEHKMSFHVQKGTITVVHMNRATVYIPHLLKSHDSLV